jgi:hypothetical protein
MHPRHKSKNKYNFWLRQNEVFFRNVFNPKIVGTALRTSLLVGTLLNIINQGHLMTPDFFMLIAWKKVVLTYCIPYLVSTYSAVSTLQRLEQKQTAEAKTPAFSNPAVSS